MLLTTRELHAHGARLVLTDVTQASVDRLAPELAPERTFATPAQVGINLRYYVF